MRYRCDLHSGTKTRHGKAQSIKQFLFAQLESGLELSGGWGVDPLQFMSTDAHFWVKISFKFQSLGKISNPPPVLLGQFQHWLESVHKIVIKQTSRTARAEYKDL